MKRLVFLVLLVLTACAPQPARKVMPALWEVRGPQGQQGWLFGTIHALPDPVDWRSPAVDAALTRSDRLVMEIGNADRPDELARIFESLMHSPGHPPLDQRVPADRRDALVRVLRQQGAIDKDYSGIETWAAALSIARTASAQAQGDFGLEAELMRAAAGKPVVELEGARAQLGIFDGLAEADQRDLLNAVVAEIEAGPQRGLEQAWARGDMAAMEREARTGLLADPELRASLLTARNRAWADAVATLLGRGARPLVAVGAAHMAGPDGLPALLAARGFTIIRRQ